jgi:hypothetical protein
MSAEHLYRILLKVYPRRFRREYAEAMAQCFRDQMRGADTTGKRVCLWLRTLADLALSIPARHWERVIRRGGWVRGRGAAALDQSVMMSIFFARLEAASFGSTAISVEHLLLGALRQERELATAILGSNGVEGIVRALGERNGFTCRQRAGDNLPLSIDSKRILAFAFWDAHASGTKVGSRHILSAIHRDPSLAGCLLRDRVLDPSRLTQRLLSAPGRGDPRDR